MRTWPNSAIFRLVVIAVMACAAHARAAEYRDSARGWSIQLPPGWAAASPEAVRQLDANAAQMIKGDKGFAFIAAFSKAPQQAMLPPYVIMQFTPGDFKGASREAVAKGMNISGAEQEISRRADASVSDLLKGLKVGSPVLDPKSSRLLSTIDLPQSGLGSLKVQSIGFIAHDGVVQLNWYDLADKPAGTAAELNAMADSFTFDPGRAWVPAASVTQGAARGAIIGAAVGAGIGIIIMIGKAVRRR